MQSILQDKKECYLTHIPNGIDKHHIFFGKGNRKISEDNGFYIYLRHEFHIADSIYSTPHNDREKDLFFKKKCQTKYEETHSREEFIKLIGRNYL